jgi:hypothetical protein
MSRRYYVDWFKTLPIFPPGWALRAAHAVHIFTLDLAICKARGPSRDRSVLARVARTARGGSVIILGADIGDREFCHDGKLRRAQRWDRRACNTVNDGRHRYGDVTSSNQRTSIAWASVPGRS